jgi:hypothetical protein
MKTYLITYSNNRNDRIDQWLLQAPDKAQAERLFWQNHNPEVVAIDDIEEDQ